MFQKNILAQRLFHTLFIVSFSTMAMDRPSSKIHSDFTGTCIPKPVKIVTFLCEHSLKCHLHTDIQRPGDLENAQNKFTQALGAYADRIKKRIDAFKVVVMPHELAFDSDTSQLTLLKYLGAQTLTNATRANLTVKTRAYFSTASKNIIDQGAVLLVEYLSSAKKPLVLNLAMLNAIYQPKKMLKLTPETQAAVTKHQIYLKALKAVKQHNGQDTSDCIEPYAHVEKLYLEDVTTMLNYYLENYNNLDVD